VLLEIDLQGLAYAYDVDIYVSVKRTHLFTFPPISYFVLHETITVEEIVSDLIPYQSPEEQTQAIMTWQQSGMSGASWCRENNIEYDVFRAWLKKYRRAEAKKNGRPRSEGSFVELQDGIQEATGVEMVCEGISIRVEKRFDEQTLLRVLSLLRRNS
jgi:hypothetical protein